MRSGSSATLRRPAFTPSTRWTWERRSASIAEASGEAVFEQHDIEVPAFWSQTATNVIASKYFRGPLGTPQRETSARQLIGRVVDTITGWGRDGGYFASEDEAETFAAELDASAAPPEGLLQQPRLVQRRRRRKAAVLGVLHPLRRRHHGVDSRLVQDRGNDLQGRIGFRREPFRDPLQQGAALQRRHRFRSCLVHAWC